ncbi:hypothetical protein BSKO_07775 [Bryopsis sp. KO-2023]|nr:hypothetical protein BSKO_07775 [Bryopsis sp. KO-2023]
MVVALTEEQYYECCNSKRFAAVASLGGPFESCEEIVAHATNVWWKETPVNEWLAAFAGHPTIGDVDALTKKDGGEQSTALNCTDPGTLDELAKLNCQYQAKFGHVFLIFAPGKTAEQVLHAIKDRIQNSPGQELQICAGEQMKITTKRMMGMLGKPAWTDPCAMYLNRSKDHGKSPITTHVLDTCRGCPAAGVPVVLEKKSDPDGTVYDAISRGVTNSDGRVGNLLNFVDSIAPGTYRMKFRTGEYLQKCKKDFPDFYAEIPFYPEVNVDFNVPESMSKQHFHIPCLLSPYGYSTYRGS